MKIRVYFNNGNVVNFDGEKASFRDNNGLHFHFREDDESPVSYADVLKTGPMINWDTVSWVREYRDEEGREL
jgi:hypothetical protein